MKILKKILPILIILMVSSATHLYLFGHPKETVFDEVHFGKFISGYYSGEYFFDIHPPLAKLLISGMGVLGGYTPNIDFAAIGDEYKDNYFLWLRLLPLIAGIFLPLVIYYLARNLTFSKTASYLAAFLVIFENSLLVQSRFILLDTLLLLFGFGSLLFYFLYRNYEGRRLALYSLLFSIILGACAFSVKWTGVSFLGLIIILEIVKLYKEKAKFKEWLARGFAVAVIPFMLYFLFFAIHFALLSKDGPGKDFMSARFQKTLSGNRHEKDDIQPLPLFDKFIELNFEMYKSNKTLDAKHPDGSSWYTWVYMKTPVYYWVSKDGHSKIYLLGNPLIYWAGSFAVLFLLAFMFLEAIEKSEVWRKKRHIMFFLLGGYFLNLLPFIGIGRVMFLYHYLSALLFSILILAFLIDVQAEKKKKIAAYSLVALSLILFLFFAPLTYGTPLTEKGEVNRFWFNSWR